MTEAEKLAKGLQVLTDSQFQGYLDAIALIEVPINTGVLAINMAEINRRSVKLHRHGQAS